MKILVVEDNVNLGKAIQTYLGSLKWDVQIAYNGLQAESSLRSQMEKGENFDCIILDRMMPLKNGTEFLLEIRKKGIHVPVIFLTAKDTVEDKVEGLEQGADDYMVKPFEMDELTARVKALVRRRTVFVQGTEKNPFAKNMRHKNLSLSILDKKATISGNSFLLTEKETEILKCFIENAGRIISKESLLREVWGMGKNEEEVKSRFLDVHVYNLRSKLEKNNYDGKIETIRNAGYRFE